MLVISHYLPDTIGQNTLNRHVDYLYPMICQLYIPAIVGYGKSHEYPIKSHQHPMVSVLLPFYAKPAAIIHFNCFSQLVFFQHKPSILWCPH